MNRNESFVGKSYMDLLASEKFYKVSIATLAIAVCILSVLVATKNVEVVVMPPDYTEPVIVNGQYANQSYSAMHGLAIAAMIGNLNERNADFVSTQLIKLLSPYLQNQIGAVIEAEATILKTRRAEQTFLVENVQYEPKNQLVWVWGRKTLKFQGGGQQTNRFTYEFRIQPNHGSPRITHYDAYKGTPKSKSSDYVVDIKPYLTLELEDIVEHNPVEQPYAEPQSVLSKMNPIASKKNESPVQGEKQ